jgi:serine/threonine protein kinase
MESQLVQELKVQYALKHPCFTTLYTFLHTDTEIVYVLEYCMDGSLHDLYQRTKRLDEREAARYLR